MAGRKPIPTKIKILRGNPGCRPLNKREPRPDKLDDLTPPAELTAAGATCWKRLAPLLQRAGVLTQADRDCLLTYCDTYARWQEVTAFLNEHGAICTEYYKNGKPKRCRPWPHVKVANDLAQHLRRLQSDMGLTPASRSKVQTIDKAVDEFELFLRGTTAGA